MLLIQMLSLQMLLYQLLLAQLMALLLLLILQLPQAPQLHARVQIQLRLVVGEGGHETALQLGNILRIVRKMRGLF